jgi:hypothetical protein
VICDRSTSNRFATEQARAITHEQQHRADSPLLLHA